MLAGRSAESVTPIADALNCSSRIFPLDVPEQVDAALADVSAVLHCAGPFARTAENMIDACFRTGTHYLDIGGEIPVLESILLKGEAAKKHGVVVLPGSGFDVVPTDCLAKKLKELLPDATELQIAMGGTVSLSPGTLKVSIETIPTGGTIRKNGKLMRVPHAWRIKSIEFDDQERCTISIPWGDVSTAWVSTGIPNIQIFGSVPRPTAITMRMIRGMITILMRSDRIRRFSEDLAGKLVHGPDATARSQNIMHIRGDVWNAQGEHRCVHMHTPEGYACTIETTLAILPRVLQGEVEPGVWTPAQAFGSDFATTIPGITFVQENEY